MLFSARIRELSLVAIASFVLNGSVPGHWQLTDNEPSPLPRSIEKLALQAIFSLQLDASILSMLQLPHMDRVLLLNLAPVEE